MATDWEVRLDDQGRVIVGPAGPAGNGEADAEGRYLVVPQDDGSLGLHALEHRAPVPGGFPEPQPPSTGPLDPDAAEAELARWGARALGDLRPGERPAPTASGERLPLIEVRSEDRPQPAATPSADAAANAPALSAVDAAWRYWLIQNRDAHDLFKTRADSSRRASVPAPSVPATPPRSPA